MSFRHNCMKPRRAVFATICAVALVGASAFGGITHTYEDNDATLVVNVDSGSETMVDTWVTAPDSTTGAAVTKIKKTGAGNTCRRATFKGTVDLDGHVLTIEGYDSLELAGNVINPGKVLVSGTLVVDSPVHVTGATTVSGGTLKVPFGTRGGTLGLYEQYCAISNSYNWNHSRAPGDPDVYSGFSPWDAGADMLREQVDLGVNKDGAVRCYHQFSDAGWGWPSSMEGNTNTKNYYWYHGYVWNHSDSPVTWKLLSGMYPSTYVWFGEDHGTTMVFDNNTHTAVPQEVTLQPGPTRID